jgi:hypothetical protein
MKRRRFGGGMERYCREGVRRQDAYVTEMQKLEFYAVDNIPLKEDRGIQFRSTTYNAALARHLHHVEPAIYSALVNIDGTPVVAKGYSPIERGLILDAMASRFREPMFILADHSRFDAAVNLELLREEHRVYLRCRGYNAELKQLLKWQEGGRGFTRGGIVYRVLGKRMSGDLNTALGNTILNWAMLKSFVDSVGCDANIFLDGDDSVIIMEKQNLPDLGAFMLAYGMTTVYEVVHDIQEAEFCQSRIVYTGDGPVMVRNPYKVMETVTKCARGLDARRLWEVLSASATSEMMANPRIPVLSVMAACLRNYAGDTGTFVTPDCYGRWNAYRATIVEGVDEGARTSFEQAWGMSIPEQLAHEEYYLSLCSPKWEECVIRAGKSRRVEVACFDVWDDCISAYEPEPIDPWWRRRWAVARLLKPKT